MYSPGDGDDLEKLKQQLIEHEGLKLTLYKDTENKWTIGCGRNLQDRGISEEEALFLLDNDIGMVREQLEERFPWFLDLDEIRQRVLSDMCFNLGITGLVGFKKMLTAVKDKHYQAASKHMLASVWATQVKRRATRLAKMMETGEEQPV